MDKISIDNWYDAINNKKFKIIKKMIQNGFDATFDHDYGFRMAAYKGSLKLMTLMLENGADINVNQSYALRTSIYQNNIDCVKFLVKWGALVSKNSLMVAIEEENIEVAEFLIENGADLDTGDDELFLTCVETSNYDFVKYLLDKNIVLYFDEKYRYYEASLYKLMKNQKFEIIETMFKMGVPPHRLFHYAIYGGMKMINLLCEYGLDYKKVNAYEFSKEWMNFDLENEEEIEVLIFILKNDFSKEVKEVISKDLYMCEFSEETNKIISGLVKRNHNKENN